jgi:hypothetical protein
MVMNSFATTVEKNVDPNDALRISFEPSAVLASEHFIVSACMLIWLKHLDT